MSKGKWVNHHSIDGRKRTELCSVCCSPKEKSVIKKCAKDLNLSISEYVLVNTVYSDELIVKALWEELLALFTHLVRMDNDFNQATKVLNIAIKYTQTDSEFSQYRLTEALQIVKEEHNQRNKMIVEIRDLLQNNNVSK